MNAGIIGERLLLTLWIGSIWAIGYIAVPLSFIHFDDVVVAGELAGRFFTIVNYLGLACGPILLIRFASLGAGVLTRWRFWLTAIMLLLVAFLHFYLQAEMVAIKLLEWRTDDMLLARFDMLHHSSTAVYGVLSIMGLALVATNDKPQ